MEIIVPQTIDLATTNITEIEYSDYNIATAYAVTNKVYVRYEIDGITPRQPTIIYEAQGATTGNYPPDDDGTNWLKISTSNKWAMFDDFVSTQTTNPASITFTLNVSKVNRIALFNLDADSVQIVLKKSDTTETGNDIIDLKKSADWYTEYFFSEPEYKKSLIHQIYGLYLNMTLEVTITARTDLYAKCGHVAVGLSKDLGLTEFGVRNSITDYSRKETNVFGETEFVVRAYAKKIELDVWIDHGTDGAGYDRVDNILADVRSTPLVWDGNNTVTNRSAFLVFGFYKNFDLTAEYEIKSNCSLDIEGLI